MDLNRNLSRHPIIQAIHDACLAVEKCGASPELTHAVTLVAALKEQAHCLLDIVAGKDGYPCTIEEADFSANTVTLKMTGKYAVSAGQYLLVPVSSLRAAAHPGTIALPVLDLMSDGGSFETCEADSKPWTPLGAALTSPGLSTGIGAFDGHVEGPAFDAIMATADEYAKTDTVQDAERLRSELLACINDLRADNKDQAAEIARLQKIIDTPQKDDFLRAVSTEAEHQRRRWGTEHDAGKTPADWYWLVVHLAGKAIHAHAAGDTVKAEHHVITTAAALANWHLAMFGKTDMRPGINPERVAANEQATEAAA